MQRYTVDLSNLFSDFRQKVFVGRRCEWKHIASLLDHIRYIFQLERRIFLTNHENIIFPDKEDLNLIQESDQLLVHYSDNYNGNRENSSKGNEAVESRVTAVNQNGKRKRRDSPIKSKPSRKDEESGSESDSDEEESVLPKIFVGLESISQQDESIDDIPKAKRKRIRKRKSKKEELNVPSKVVVKTYGKSKIPAIISENGTPNHIRFENTNADENDEDENDDSVLAEEEPYRNLNAITAPRIIKAVLQPSAPIGLNDDAPSIPEYDGDLEFNILDKVGKTKKNKRQQRKSNISLDVKQELIEANSERASSPTWDTEMDQAKENFLSAYRGEEFWLTLQKSLENFPNINIPNVNDIIAYRINAQSYLALVEQVDDGENDERPALKLTLRKLNETKTMRPEPESVTLDQLTDIRLVATYLP